MTISKADLEKINRLRNTPLVAACRYNDALVDHYRGTTDNGLVAALTDMELDSETLLHVAMQRVMRVMKMDELSEATSTMLAALMFDGITIGWTARQFATDGVPNPMDPVNADDV